MKNGITIDGNFNKETVENIKSLIETVFKSGRENQMDQQTIKVALQVTKEIAGVRNVSINDCVFKTDKF